MSLRLEDPPLIVRRSSTVGDRHAVAARPRIDLREAAGRVFPHGSLLGQRRPPRSSDPRPGTSPRHCSSPGTASDSLRTGSMRPAVEIQLPPRAPAADGIARGPSEDLVVVEGRPRCVSFVIGRLKRVVDGLLEEATVVVPDEEMFMEVEERRTDEGAGLSRNTGERGSPAGATEQRHRVRRRAGWSARRSPLSPIAPSSRRIVLDPIPEILVGRSRNA